MRVKFLFFFVLSFLIFPVFIGNSQSLNPSNIASSQIAALEEPITDDYILGPGDRLLLSIKGKVVNVSYELVITADGNIIIPEVGTIYCSGSSIKSLKKKLEGLIPKYY
ncbi:polysaccharide biosynthesis/export family protein, partial [bacterium]|nr:polysaccharide biosynthesis/export family protein [bacterium]